ncbi:hypothetical protein DC366_11735 [Pelagivirga sediminicola]|uniref:Mitochondrial inner membrane protein n=1 Tax=Pelagivirga sediminicola TaxID=2170575 RepID=A0A2T7G5X3_9RHOB|nr:hypothetical protein [Pelagivirga sediminicola]PVA09786.1 hypothetical protein DC366_11735 [Pelagivirga sediminicola]
MAEKKGPSGRKGTAAKGKDASAGADAEAKPEGANPSGTAAKGAPKPGKAAAGKSAAAKTSTAASAPKRAAAKSGTATSDSSVKSDAATSDSAKSDTAKTSAAKPSDAATGATATGAKPTSDAKPGIGSDASSGAGSISQTADGTSASSIPASGPRSTGPAAASAASGAARETKPAAATASTSTARSAASATPAQPAPQRKGGFVPLLLGGVCAAAIGFGAAYYMGIMAPDQTAQSDLDARLADQAARIDQLQAQIDGLPAAPDTSGFEAAQSDLDARISQLAEQVETVSGRLAEVEAQPSGTDGTGVTTGQLTDLRQTVNAQGEQIAALVAEAERRDDVARASAQQDLRRAALTRIRTALDTGTPFDEALGDLERAGMSAPDALQDVAAAGVPTQAALQADFAPAARAALATARKSGDEDDGGFWSFMSGQLGARSLERREGPGTDATLSRAEDDMRQGNLEAAVSEVETLPDPARAELSDWAASVRARIEALAAYDALAAKLN